MSSRVPFRKPEVPTVVMVGLALYIVSFAVGLIGGIITGEPGIDEASAGPILGLGCIALLVLAADILGVVMACLGRAWGAILMMFSFGVGFLVSVAMAGVAPSLPPFCYPVAILSRVSGIASLVCFLVPSAWRYYEASAAYRKNRL